MLKLLENLTNTTPLPFGVLNVDARKASQLEASPRNSFSKLLAAPNVLHLFHFGVSEVVRQLSIAVFEDPSSVVIKKPCRNQRNFFDPF